MEKRVATVRLSSMMPHPFDGLKKLAHDIQVDKAITEAQLVRHYSVRLSELPVKAFPRVEHSLSPTKGSGEPKLVTFICGYRRIVKRNGRKLQHLAGLAEMRHLLGAQVDDWASHADASHGVAEADGEWRSSVGRVAVEYDIGSYSTSYILTKAYSLEHKGYHRLVWGCPSERLVRSRQETLGKLNMDVQVLYAPWC